MKPYAGFDFALRVILSMGSFGRQYVNIVQFDWNAQLRRSIFLLLHQPAEEGLSQHSEQEFPIDNNRKRE